MTSARISTIMEKAAEKMTKPYPLVRMRSLSQRKPIRSKKAHSLQRRFISSSAMSKNNGNNNIQSPLVDLERALNASALTNVAKNLDSLNVK